MQQQGDAQCTAEELGDIGRHRGDFRRDPHADHDPPGELFPAEFRKIASGDNAQLGGHCLEQHRDEACDQHDPQQLVAVGRAGLDVGREVAGVHIGNRRHDRGAGKRQERPHTFAAPAERVARSEFRL